MHIVRMSHASLDRELTTAKGILARAAQTETELRALLSEAEAAGAGDKHVSSLSVCIDPACRKMRPGPGSRRVRSSVLRSLHAEMAAGSVPVSRALAVGAPQEAADLRAAVAALQADKAELTAQLGDRVDELMEITERLEAEKAAAEQREADLREVRGGMFLNASPRCAWWCIGWHRG